MTEEEKQSFAKKLNQLFELRKKKNGQPYTHEEVSNATGITTGAISKLRRGQISNPSHKVIDALAKFFDVEPNYFFEFSHHSEEEDSAFLDMISLRASELSEGGRRALLDMLDTIIKLEEAHDENDHE